jgi:hypothetical protein
LRLPVSNASAIAQIFELTPERFTKLMQTNHEDHQVSAKEF